MHVLSLDSGKASVWTENTGQEAQPVWTPDGTAIVFTTGTADSPRSSTS